MGDGENDMKPEQTEKTSSSNTMTIQEEDSGSTLAEDRLKQLEKLFLLGPEASEGQSYSMETLLDLLLFLYDECTNSSLRREKTVSDFIEFGKSF